jgi:hypothetical protein
MAEKDTRDPKSESGGADAARNGPYRRLAPAGTPEAAPDHRRHESSAELDRRARDGAKPYTTEVETYRNPATDDPRDPDQREDARKKVADT